jgi:hypothetical protein
MQGDRKAVFAALVAKYGDDNVLYGKDSGFCVRGRGFVSLPHARRETGITPLPRQYRPVSQPYGDYATMIALSRVRFGGR